ncbi:MAG TPA: J domain-containing protein [Dehalococcoidia bacterium]|nr:J domain-containing protein [Dehalococcoidia bacterium]
MPEEFIKTKKTVPQTLADLRLMFAKAEIEDWEAVPTLDSPAYSVRYHNGQAWVEISSRIQPTKAMNLRQCFQVVDNLLRWQIRGISGVASGQAFISGLPAVVNGPQQKGSEFIEACGTLGVDPEDSWEEISAVFRVKVQRAHPDHGGDAARFKRLNNAYQIVDRVKGPKHD